ncbi:MAG TPA: T9SS type A sorting domain-containing protein, partial [Bacteroidales bacterium]|nr:T9SS type A sorting domain-containing protein [Bacteroidales bacterium]
WSPYKGLPQANEYYIYRGKTKESMEFVATVPASQTYYSLNIDGYNYYRISMPINQSFVYNSQEYTHTYSNISTVRDWTGFVKREHQEIFAYPNPVVWSNVNIQLPQADNERVIYLFDLQGREIYKATIEPWNTQVEVPTIGLKAGVYLCMITEQSSLLFVEKIVCNSN